MPSVVGAGRPSGTTRAVPVKLSTPRLARAGRFGLSDRPKRPGVARRSGLTLDGYAPRFSGMHHPRIRLTWNPRGSYDVGDDRGSWVRLQGEGSLPPVISPWRPETPRADVCSRPVTPQRFPDPSSPTFAGPPPTWLALGVLVIDNDQATPVATPVTHGSTRRYDSANVRASAASYRSDVPASGARGICPSTPQPWRATAAHRQHPRTLRMLRGRISGAHASSGLELVSGLRNWLVARRRSQHQTGAPVCHT